ncbi:MAG: TatD family hydrolase [Acidobacteriota bacterium]|nr:TatD family hydrolase [Acidobacteriota bacterium]
MEFVDSHCHLDDAQFDEDRAEVIVRAREAGLKYMLSIGTGDGPPDLEVAIRLAEQYSFVFATVGVHPNEAAKADETTFSHLERLVEHPKVRALGEIGLDYHWGVPKEVQMPAFVRQLEIAAAAKMPIVIHSRDAWTDTLNLLREHWAPSNLPGVMHCFTGTAEQARECLDLGFHLAFGGVSTFPKAGDVREAARITPMNRLLLETDCPYLAPAPYRGKRNEPAYLVKTAEVISQTRGISLEELAAETTRNFEELFKLH